MSEKDWEVEFDKEFKPYFGLKESHDNNGYERLKEAVRTLLSRRILLPEKKEAEHDECGECGCSYDEDMTPCEIRAEERNNTIDEIAKLNGEAGE